MNKVCRPKRLFSCSKDQAKLSQIKEKIATVKQKKEEKQRLSEARKENAARKAKEREERKLASELLRQEKAEKQKCKQDQRKDDSEKCGSSNSEGSEELRKAAVIQQGFMKNFFVVQKKSEKTEPSVSS